MEPPHPETLLCQPQGVGGVRGSTFPSLVLLSVPWGGHLLSAVPWGLQVMRAQTWRRCRGLLSLPPWPESYAPYTSKKQEIKQARPVAQDTFHGALLGTSGVKLPGSGSPGEVVLFSDALLAYFSGFSCVVAAGVDHCAEQDHGCEQLCLNTEDSFVCQCSEGFLINDDLKTCSRECPSRCPYREELCHRRGEREGRGGPPCPLLVARGRWRGCPLGAARLPGAGGGGFGRCADRDLIPWLGGLQEWITAC